VEETLVWWNQSVLALPTTLENVYRIWVIDHAHAQDGWIFAKFFFLRAYGDGIGFFN